MLEKVVKEYLNIGFDNLQFTKTDNGQWICPSFYFSLSHTDSLVCVAVSDAPIGVDAEIVHVLRQEIAGRILTDSEREMFCSLQEKEKNDYLLSTWVKKESIFKMMGARALLPKTIETDEHVTLLRQIKVEGRCYVIAVCSEAKNEIDFKFMEEI